MACAVSLALALPGASLAASTTPTSTILTSTTIASPAVQFYDYKAVFDGSGSYSQVYTAAGISDIDKASFHWHAVFPKLVILGNTKSLPEGGFPVSGAGASDPQASTFTGSGSVDDSGPNVSNPCSCSGSLTTPAGVRGIVRISANSLVRGGYVLLFQPLFGGAPAEQPAGVNDCADIGGPEASDFWQDYPANNGVTDNSPLFQGGAGVKPATQRKVIENVSADTSEGPRSDCGTTPDLGITCTVTSTAGPAGSR